MSIQGLTITCTSTPQSVAGSALHGVLRVTLRNHGAGTAYLGDSAVTTAGFQLTTADGIMTITMYTGEQLFVASSSGATPVMSVLRTNETT